MFRKHELDQLFEFAAELQWNGSPKLKETGDLIKKVLAHLPESACTSEVNDIECQLCGNEITQTKD